MQFGQYSIISGHKPTLLYQGSQDRITKGHTAAEMVCWTNFYMIAVLLANEMTDLSFASNLGL